MFSRYRVPIAFTSAGTALLAIGLVVPLTVGVTHAVQAQAPTASATSLPEIPQYRAPQGTPVGEIRRDPFIPDNATPQPIADGTIPLPPYATRAPGGAPNGPAPAAGATRPAAGAAGVPPLPPNFGAGGVRLAPGTAAPASAAAVPQPPEDAVTAVVTGANGNYALVQDGGRTRIVKNGDVVFGRKIAGVSFTSGVAFTDGSHLGIPVSAR